MGWHYTHGQTRKELIKSLLETSSRIVNDEKRNKLFRKEWSTLTYCTVGNVLWSVRLYQLTDLDTGILCSEKFICCDLLQKSSDGWGYKPMTEHEGPAYYSCPVSYFDLAPHVPDGYAASWRKAVLDRLKKIADNKEYVKTLKNGDVFKSNTGSTAGKLGFAFSYFFRNYVYGRSIANNMVYKVKLEDLAI